MGRLALFVGAVSCLAAGVVGACSNGDSKADGGSDGGIDATADVVTNDTGTNDAGVTCAWDKPFGAPVVLAELNVNGDGAQNARLSPDGLTVYFTRVPSDGGTGDLYTATRTSTSQPFGAPVALQGPNTQAFEQTPTVTGDQLTLYYSAAFDILVSTRANTMTSFGAGSPVAAVNTNLVENGSYVLPDHSALWFNAARDPDGGLQVDAGLTVRIFRSPVVNGSVGAPVEVALGGAFAAAVSPDELTVYFSSNRQGSIGVSDIWAAHRAGKNDPFGTPMNVTSLNVSKANQQPDFITADGCTLYFHSNRADPNGGYAIYRASR